jgi:putative Holliday junction resolvase
MSDLGGVLATPLMIIDRKVEPDDFGTILALLRKHGVNRVVVGLPLAADGTSGRQARKVEEFVQRLAQQTSVPIEFRDERLSTVSATAYLREVRGNRHGKKVREDAAAAAVILQAYLDEHRS